MKFEVVIHQKNKLPDLRDEYPTEEAAIAAIRVMSDQATSTDGVIVSPSGRVSFKVADFAGAEYSKIEPPFAMVVTPRRRYT